MAYRFGVLTLSDKGARGEREDTAGPLVEELLAGQGFVSVCRAVLPDDEEAIARMLARWVDEKGLDLVVTTGGTGLAPRDVTPEATRRVVEREIPGMAEAMRAASLRVTPRGMLSRGLAGVRGRALIVNLPGSRKAVRENLEVLLPVLGHALAKIQGDPADCGG